MGIIQQYSSILFPEKILVFSTSSVNQSITSSFGPGWVEQWTRWKKRTAEEDARLQTAQEIENLLISLPVRVVSLILVNHCLYVFNIIFAKIKTSVPFKPLFLLHVQVIYLNFSYLTIQTDRAINKCQTTAS